MKKIIFCLVILLVGFACNNREKNKDSEKDESATDISLSSDIEEINNADSLAQYFEKKGSIVKMKDALPDNAGFYVYFQLIKGKPKNLKFYIQYEDHDLYKFSVDGERYTYKTLKSKGKGDDKICWYDYPVKSIDMKLLRSIIKSEGGRIIFSDGRSVVITKEAKEGLRRTLDYFEFLGGQFPPYI